MTFLSSSAWQTNGKTLKFLAPITVTPSSVFNDVNQGTVEIAGTGNVFTGSGGNGTLTVSNGRVRFSGNSTTSFTSANICLRLDKPDAIFELVDDAEVVLNSSNAAFVSRSGNYDSASGAKGSIYVKNRAKLTINSGTYLNCSDSGAPSDFFQSGGTVTFKGEARLGHNSTGTGVSIYELSGDGKLIHTSSTYDGFGIGRTGAGILRILGGEMEAVGVRIPQPTSGNDQGGTGVLELLGGSLTVGASGITMPGVPAKSTIVFGGGTLKTLTSWELKGFTQITMKEATITPFAPASDTTLTITSALPGTGGLEAAGPGILKLNGANTYTGPTHLTGGTLLLGAEGALPQGSDFTMTGGTLDLNGASLVTVKAKSLTLNGGTINMNVADAASDSFEIQGGALTIGEDAQTTLNLSFGVGAPVGTYTLASGFSSNTGSLDNLVLISNLNPTTFVSELRISESALQLVVSPATADLAWAEASGDWSTDPNHISWVNMKDPDAPSAFEDGDFVTFPSLDAIPQATVTVTGGVLPALISFDNAATAYTFNDGGSAMLTVSTDQVTAINGAEVVFNIPVTMTQSLTLASGSSLAFNRPWGSIPASTEATYEGKLTFENAASTLMLNQPSGSIQIFDYPTDAATKFTAGFDGSGSIVVKGDSSVLLRDAQPNFSGQIQVAGNALLRLNSSGTGEGVGMFSHSSTLTTYPITASGSSVVEQVASEATGWGDSNRNRYFARLSGQAVFKKTNSSYSNLIRNFELSGSAQLINASPANSSYSGEWRIQPPCAIKATGAGSEITIGSLYERPFTLVGGGAAYRFVTFDVDSGARVIFSAPLNGASDENRRLLKTGVGEMVFTGALAHSAYVDVAAGTLVINSTTISGNATYTIGDGINPALLKGSAILTGTGGVTVKSNAAIETGLTVNDITFEDGSLIVVPAEKTILTVNGMLTTTGTLIVDPRAVNLEETGYGKVCTVMTWPEDASAPASYALITDQQLSNFLLRVDGNELELWRASGILVSLY